MLDKKKITIQVDFYVTLGSINLVYVPVLSSADFCFKIYGMLSYTYRQNALEIIGRVTRHSDFQLYSLIVEFIFIFPLSIDCSEFCSIVRKIFIYTTEEVKRLSPKIKLPVPSEAKSGKPDAEVALNTEDHSSIAGSGC